MATWHFLLSPRKKGARKFFSRFQEAAIELFTLSAVWRDKCTLTKLWSHLVRGRTFAQQFCSQKCEAALEAWDEQR